MEIGGGLTRVSRKEQVFQLFTPCSSQMGRWHRPCKLEGRTDRSSPHHTLSSVSNRKSADSSGAACRRSGPSVAGVGLTTGGGSSQMLAITEKGRKVIRTVVPSKRAFTFRGEWHINRRIKSMEPPAGNVMPDVREASPARRSIPQAKGASTGSLLLHGGAHGMRRAGQGWGCAASD